MARLGDVERTVIEGLSLLPARYDSVAARVMIFATGLQESNFDYTKQINGPACGWYQFERGGGTIEVLTNPTTKNLARSICMIRCGSIDSHHVQRALIDDQVLATALCRLNYYRNPKALPEPGKVHTAYDYYDQTWRPGKKRPKDWPENYWRAVGFVEDSLAVRCGDI